MQEIKDRSASEKTQASFLDVLVTVAENARLLAGGSIIAGILRLECVSCFPRLIKA